MYAGYIFLTNFSNLADVHYGCHVWTAPWQELSDVGAELVGCGHVSDLPLALMLCAERVPIESPHSEVR